jgi:hypothetical protein
LELDSAKFIEVKGISPKAKSILEQLQAKYSSIDTIILDSYTHSFLSMGLFSDQVTIPSDICDIALDNIKDLFSSRLFNAFKAIGLKAVKDVFRNNIENDIKIKNLGKSTLSEFLVFWDKTLNEEFENVRKASEKKQNDISFLPQDFLDIELDFIEDEIDRKIFNKLKPNNIILVRDFIQTNITTFSTMPYIGGSILKLIEKNQHYFLSNVDEIKRKYTQNKYGVDLLAEKNTDDNILDIFFITILR